MPNAQIWSGITQGLANTSEYMSQADIRAAQLAEAQARRQKAQIELQEYTEAVPTRQRARELEMQQLEANTRAINQQSTQQQTYDAFRRFEADKDVRHLNTWLNDVKRNPVGANLYGDVVRVDQLTKTAENDQLLRQMGYADLDAVYNDPELSKDLVVMTGTNNRGIINMNDMYAGTGFANYLSNEQLTEVERKARINQMLRQGQSGHKVTMQERVVQDLIDTGKASSVAEAYQMTQEMGKAPPKGTAEERAIASILTENPGMTYAEAYTKVKQLGRASAVDKPLSTEQQAINSILEANPNITYAEAYAQVKRSAQREFSSTEERAVKQIMEDSPGMSYTEALDKYYATRRQSTGETNESRFVQEFMQNNPEATYEQAAAEYRNLAKTTTQKEIADVQALRQGLDEMNWLESSVADMSTVDRARIYRDYISPLEDLRNFSLSTEDKRVIRNLRDLTMLGATAGSELTPDETGLLDTALNSVSKYIFDEVGGKKATSSYETFRNIYRNALYGASLTKSEIDAFNKAAGTLNQQLQPVLAQLQVQMETVKTNLEAIRDLNDPDIAHYYLGAPIEDIDKAIEAIDERLNIFSLNLNKADKGQEVRVQKVQQTAEPTLPDVNGQDKQPFDFDAAMKEVGL